MRWIYLLLISVLMLGQVHLCAESYQLANGQTCLTCLDLNDHPNLTANDQPSLAATGHGDCHDCCKVRPCSEDGKSTLDSIAPYSGIQPAACLPSKFRLELPPVSEPDPISVHVVSAPTNGPPGSTSSRAPPKFRIHLSSAGRTILTAKHGLILLQPS